MKQRSFIHQKKFNADIISGNIRSLGLSEVLTLSGVQGLYNQSPTCSCTALRVEYPGSYIMYTVKQGILAGLACNAG